MGARFFFFFCPEFGVGGGGLNSAEDGACALNCSRTGIENQEGVPYTFSVYFFFFPLVFFKLEQGSLGLMSC